jgi:flagellar hook-associated protein 1 FlgK
MSDLLSLLGLGANGIAAQNRGVGVAGNNVSNVNTPGYSRQRVSFEALQGTPHAGGVRAAETERVASSMLAARIRTSGGSLAKATAYAEALSHVEHLLVGEGATLDEQLGSLYAKFNQVAATPTDGSAREAVFAAARELVAGIQRRATATEALRTDSDARIRATATSVTSLAKQLAAVNQAIGTSPGDPTLHDKRDELARQLAQLTGGTARIDADGQMRFVLDGGAVLVDGTRGAALTATPDPGTGLARLAVVDGNAKRDVTSEIASGTLGGELAFRDQAAARTLGQLDQLAYDIATSVNAVHTAHAGLDGVSGRPMFTPLTSVAGAAKALALDPALAADPKLLATAAPGTGPGNNAGALALFGLSTSKLTDDALGIVGDVANAYAEAKADVTRGELVGEHLAGLRDSLSGVDVQEEMTNLARFEHAANALVKFVSTIDDMLGSLIAQL